jgi:hypothetical protein
MKTPEKIEVIDTYNKEGYWIKRSVNGVPVFVPKQDAPRVHIINQDTEWVMEKFWMTPEEYKNQSQNFPQKTRLTIK